MSKLFSDDHGACERCERHSKRTPSFTVVTTCARLPENHTVYARLRAASRYVLDLKLNPVKSVLPGPPFQIKVQEQAQKLSVGSIPR